MNLRPMTMADADFMISLKNDTTTREFAIVSHDEIDKANHYKWLEENLQYFQVIGDNYGALRIQDGEISIWINKNCRDNGIATWVLNEVSENGMTAKIVVRNIASMRAFINAGFKPVEYKDGYLIFQK